jgi:Predicted Zn-dependent peptidases
MQMKKFLLLSALALLCCYSVSAQQKGDAPKTNIEFIEYDLPNGLHVILYEEHSTPNVMMSIMYHVGSKNEQPHLTGFAHLFEHLMFEGSANIQRGEFFKLVQSRGGELNANTSADRTFYFEFMPSNELELVIWMEADRMLQAQIDSIGVATQKGVVIEERKQSYDSRPYGSFLEEAGKRAFTQHPYQWQTIGYPEHIRNSSFEDVFNFYKTYYVPNNAVVVISGDIDVPQTKAWIEKYFGSIPRGTRPIYRPEIVEPPLQAEVRDTIYDNIQLPAVFMAYRGPATGTKDAYAIDVLSQIMYGSAGSRFNSNIVDKGLALETALLQLPLEHPSLCYVLGVANVGADVAEVETALNAELERVQNELVSEEEFQMAMASAEFRQASGLTQLANITEELATNYTYFKDAGRINRQLEFYSQLSRQDLLDAAKKYFSQNNRVVLYYLPKSAQ